MFIAVLFTVARIWKQLRYPSTGRRISKHVWYIYTVKNYTAVKNNKLVTHNNMDASFKDHAKQKKPDLIGYII